MCILMKPFINLYEFIMQIIFKFDTNRILEVNVYEGNESLINFFSTYMYDSITELSDCCLDIIEWNKSQADFPLEPDYYRFKFSHETHDKIKVCIDLYDESDTHERTYERIYEWIINKNNLLLQIFTQLSSLKKIWEAYKSTWWHDFPDSNFNEIKKYLLIEWLI